MCWLTRGPRPANQVGPNRDFRMRLQRFWLFLLAFTLSTGLAVLCVLNPRVNFTYANKWSLGLGSHLLMKSDGFLHEEGRYLQVGPYMLNYWKDNGRILNGNTITSPPTNAP